tara:strand:- start:3671 stop:6646 length:2976 start_codon:yes stop_codon:yes gene_type:complete
MGNMRGAYSQRRSEGDGSIVAAYPVYGSFNNPFQFPFDFEMAPGDKSFGDASSTDHWGKGESFVYEFKSEIEHRTESWDYRLTPPVVNAVNAPMFPRGQEDLRRKQTYRTQGRPVLPRRTRLFVNPVDYYLPWRLGDLRIFNLNTVVDLHRVESGEDLKWTKFNVSLGVIDYNTQGRLAQISNGTIQYLADLGVDGCMARRVFKGKTIFVGNDGTTPNVAILRVGKTNGVFDFQNALAFQVDQPYGDELSAHGLPATPNNPVLSVFRYRTSGRWLPVGRWFLPHLPPEGGSDEVKVGLEAAFIQKNGDTDAGSTLYVNVIGRHAVTDGARPHRHIPKLYSTWLSHFAFEMNNVEESRAASDSIVLCPTAEHFPYYPYVRASFAPRMLFRTIDHGTVDECPFLAGMKAFPISVSDSPVYPYRSDMDFSQLEDTIISPFTFGGINVTDQIEDENRTKVPELTYHYGLDGKAYFSSSNLTNIKGANLSVAATEVDTSVYHSHNVEVRRPTNPGSFSFNGSTVKSITCECTPCTSDLALGEGAQHTAGRYVDYFDPYLNRRVTSNNWPVDGQNQLIAKRANASRFIAQQLYFPASYSQWHAGLYSLTQYQALRHVAVSYLDDTLWNDSGHTHAIWSARRSGAYWPGKGQLQVNTMYPAGAEMPLSGVFNLTDSYYQDSQFSSTSVSKPNGGVFGCFQPSAAQGFYFANNGTLPWTELIPADQTVTGLHAIYVDRIMEQTAAVNIVAQAKHTLTASLSSVLFQDGFYRFPTTASDFAEQFYSSMNIPRGCPSVKDRVFYTNGHEPRAALALCFDFLTETQCSGNYSVLNLNPPRGPSYSDAEQWSYYNYPSVYGGEFSGSYENRERRYEEWNDSYNSYTSHSIVHEQDGFWGYERQRLNEYGMQRGLLYSDVKSNLIDYRRSYGHPLRLGDMNSYSSRRKMIMDRPSPRTNYLFTPHETERFMSGQYVQLVDSSGRPKIFKTSDGILGFTMRVKRG